MSRSIRVYLISAAILHLGWELGHSPLYDWTVPPLRPEVGFYLYRIGLSWLGDIGYSLLALVLVWLITRRNWWLAPRRRDHVWLVMISLAIAIAIEVKARISGSWTYGAAMPTVWGLGLTPLIQMPFINLTAALCTFKWRKERS